MSAMQSEVFEAFRAIDVPEDKALKAAEALSRRDPDASAEIKILRTDVGILKTDIGVLKTDVSVLKADVGVLKSDVGTLKSDVAVLKWMMGFALAFLVAISIKLFLH